MKIATRSLTTALAAVALLSGAASAQTLPPAKEVVDRYVQAIGGRDAVLRLRATRTLGTFEMPAAGIKGDVEVLSAQPGKMVTRITIPGLGEIRRGYDGTVSWSADPISGARVHEGRELQATRDQAQELYAVRDPSLFTSMETVERTEVGGAACYKVKLVWKSGRENHECYAVDSGLLVAMMDTQESPMGSVEVVSVASDYKEFNGVKQPTKLTIQAGGQEQVLTVTSVEVVTPDAAAFNLPPEIAALVRQQ